MPTTFLSSRLCDVRFSFSYFFESHDLPSRHSSISIKSPPPPPPFLYEPRFAHRSPLSYGPLSSLPFLFLCEKIFFLLFPYCEPGSSLTTNVFCNLPCSLSCRKRLPIPHFCVSPFFFSHLTLLCNTRSYLDGYFCLNMVATGCPSQRRPQKTVSCYGG